MTRSTRARISSRSAHPSLKAGKSRYHSHRRTIHYLKVGGIRRKASDVERFGLLAGRR